MKYLDNIINDNILQNYIINGDMSIYQRQCNTGIVSIAGSAGAYTLDRFRVTNNSASVTLSVAQVRVSDTERILIGADKLYWLNISGSSVTINAKTEQRIENVRQFCNKTMISVLWVVGTVGDTITPVISANFGTGGATQESIAVLESHNTTITTTGVPQKIYFTFTVPAYMGYTFGADATSYLSVGLNHVSSGAYIRYTGWQLNIGTAVVPFTLCARNPFDERTLCQRYYEKSYRDNRTPGVGTENEGSIHGTTYPISGNNYFSIRYKTRKRIAVGASTYSVYVSSNSGITDWYTGSAKGQASCAVVYADVETPMMVTGTYGGTGAVQWLNYHYVADAEL